MVIPTARIRTHTTTRPGFEAIRAASRRTCCVDWVRPHLSRSVPPGLTSIIGLAYLYRTLHAQIRRTCMHISDSHAPLALTCTIAQVGPPSDKSAPRTALISWRTYTNNYWRLLSDRDCVVSSILTLRALLLFALFKHAEYATM